MFAILTAVQKKKTPYLLSDDGDDRPNNCPACGPIHRWWGWGGVGWGHCACHAQALLWQDAAKSDDQVGPSACRAHDSLKCKLRCGLAQLSDEFCTRTSDVEQRKSGFAYNERHRGLGRLAHDVEDHRVV
jgi:hypothetical protein